MPSIESTRRLTRPFLMVGLAATLGACAADRLTSAEPTLSRSSRSSADGGVESSTSGSGTASVLKRAGAAVVESDTATIGSNGGVLELKSAGLKIVVPMGAVSSPTKFSVRTVAGGLVAYDFQPHGVRFAAPLKFEQDLSKTEAGKADLRTMRLEGAYFADARQLDARLGTALVDQFLPIDLDVNRHKVSMKLWHFSGYMMSTGRK